MANRGVGMPEISGYSESGAPIYKYDKPRDGFNPPVFEDEETMQRIEKHIVTHVGIHEEVYHEIISETIHVDIYPVMAGEGRNYHTLVTSGMSTLPMNTPQEYGELKYAELAAILPEDWPMNDEAFKDERYYWPVRALKFLARFPHEYRTWLAYGHTIPNGNPPKPYANNTKLNSILILPSITLPREFQHLTISPAKKINFYTIVPLYEEEVKYKLKYGVEKLLELFDDKEVTDMIRIDRPNVCKKRFWFF